MLYSPRGDGRTGIPPKKNMHPGLQNAIAALEERALEHGKHVMVAGIAADNEASIRLHEQLGFVESGRMPEVGFKFGRWLDLVMMQKRLLVPDPPAIDNTDAGPI